MVTQLNELQKEVSFILELISKDEVVKMMETMRDPKAFANHLTKEHGVSLSAKKDTFNRQLCTAVVAMCSAPHNLNYFIAVQDRNDGKYVQIGKVPIRMRELFSNHELFILLSSGDVSQ